MGHNIIKPIEDALHGLVYADDDLITEVDSHRRSLAGIFDLDRPPGLILKAVALQEKCVYVRVEDPRPLEDYL